MTVPLRRMGHEAWSCDILPTIGPEPDWHIHGDVRGVLDDNWDMIIAFPPCTDLAVSGARWFPQKREDGRQQAAIDFFMLFANHPCPRIAIENPVGIISRVWRRPDQIIHPWMFGHPESKTTCIWLRWLPPLLPTDVLTLPPSGRWENQTPSGQNRLGPSPERAMRRGITYPGVAEAMARQWGALIPQEGT